MADYKCNFCGKKVKDGYGWDMYDKAFCSERCADASKFIPAGTPFFPQGFDLLIDRLVYHHLDEGIYES